MIRDIMILIENLNYAVDKELNVYKNVDILIKKEDEENEKTKINRFCGGNYVACFSFC